MKQAIKITEFKEEFRFLSNFYPSPFTHRNILYPTNEHFYQAFKTTDKNIRIKIAAAKTPGKAKRIGSNIILREQWENNKIRVMEKGLSLKFCINSKLSKMLMATSPAELYEGNYWGDIFWGIDLKNNCIGENWLGKLLMRRRDFLLKQDD